MLNPNRGGEGEKEGMDKNLATFMLFGEHTGSYHADPLLLSL